MILVFGGGDFVFAFDKHFEVQKESERSRDTHITRADSDTVRRSKTAVAVLTD